MVMTHAAVSPLLAVENIEAFYGQFQALFGISLSVGRGEIVSIIGANGAGKSTLMKAVIGQIGSRTGRVSLCGTSLDGLATREIVRAGVALVPEGRRLFASLTVQENLEIGLRLRSGPGLHLDEVYDLFPVLAERRKSRAGDMSGGQQQMVAIGRALLCGPKVLLCDEISIGLAPAIIGQLYDIIPRISALGIGIVIVEQDITRSLKVSNRFYCLLRGRVALSGASADADRDAVAKSYLGS